MLAKRHSPIAVACAIVAAGSLACASSGPSGPTPDQTLALTRVAGAWNYDQAATAQAANIRGVRPEDHLTQRASDVAMDQMRERGVGGQAVSGTDAGLRQTMLMVGVTPRTLAVDLMANTLSLSYDGEAQLVMPVGGGWADATTTQGSIEVRLRWDGDAFAVERRIPGGGTIRDGFSILESGHLLLTRDIVWRQPQRVGLIVFGR